MNGWMDVLADRWWIASSRKPWPWATGYSWVSAPSPRHLLGPPCAAGGLATFRESQLVSFRYSWPFPEHKPAGCAECVSSSPSSRLSQFPLQLILWSSAVASPSNQGGGLHQVAVSMVRCRPLHLLWGQVRTEGPVAPCSAEGDSEDSVSDPGLPGQGRACGPAMRCPPGSQKERDPDGPPLLVT